jgi:hypothetical protein
MEGTAVAELKKREPILKRANQMYKPKSLHTPAVILAAVGLIAFYAVPALAAPRCGGTRTASISIRDDFNSGSLKAWEMPFPEDWEILKEGNLHYLHMKRSRPPELPRHPVQFARLKGVKVGSFTLNVKVRREGGSMMVIFNYVDPLHFYYAHLSENPGTQMAGHNGIFIVEGGPRRRIAGLNASPALPDQSWHDVRIVRNVRTGSIQVFLDNQTVPRFSVVDRTFTCGQVGLGSFDEIGDFAHFRLHSNDALRSAAGKE